MKTKSEEPLPHPLILITKKYLSAFSQQTNGLALDRYQFVLVLIDDNHEELTQKALADLLKIDKSYMVTIVDYLSGLGYVLREKNPADRREQLIRLTPKAHEDIPHIRNIIANLNRQSFSNLSNNQVETFNQVLEVIHKNLSHQFEADYMFDYTKLAAK